VTVRRASDHFRRRPPSFKCRRGEAQTNVGSQLRTEAEDLVGGLLPGIGPDELSPASVPARLNLAHRARFVPNVWALSAVFGFGRSPRRRRSDGSTNQMHDATTPASEIGDEQPDHLDSDLDRFGPVWNRDSKSESPHGRGIILYLDYLDYSLERRRGDARAGGRAGAQVAVPPMRENRPIRPNGRRPHRPHAVCSWKAESKPVQRASKIVPNRGWSL
jgi:hypothetical protein